MNAETKPVDVLGRPLLQVMDDHIQGCEVALKMNRAAKDSALIAEAIREFRAARAAVAELIDVANRAAIAACRGDDSHPGTIRNAGLDALRAALARIGGAK